MPAVYSLSVTFLKTKSRFLQHMPASGVLSDRIGIYRRHSPFMKGKIYYQTFRLCSFTTSMPNSARYSSG